MLDPHSHMALFHQADRLRGDPVVDVLQQLEPFLRVAQNGPQGGGVSQAHPGKARNANAHAVFVDAGIHLQVHRDNLSANGAAGVRGGQRHAHRLGAAQGGNHLLTQQGQQLFFCNHMELSSLRMALRWIFSPPV